MLDEDIDPGFLLSSVPWAERTMNGVEHNRIRGCVWLSLDCHGHPAVQSRHMGNFFDGGLCLTPTPIIIAPTVLHTVTDAWMIGDGDPGGLST